ncbi:MAG: TIR domain-containing protein [Opitutae bacterium]|nr:TIR domain-containing protein [Opitutae bacterium]
MSGERSELNVERSAPQGAVFLSYAREDTDAARRIAEALRGFGVEVWLDQAELRGGDQWDAKIKKQIRECALFLAVVSAHTQERAEGYFRREWKLAVERTQDMAAGTVFLVPVVVDDTREAEALVPEEFMRVQWTRLPGALPTPQFVAQVKSLLGNRRKPALKPDLPRPPTLPPQFKQSAQKTEDREQRTEDGRAGPKPAVPGWMWGVAAAVLVTVGVGVVLLRQPSAPASPAPASVLPDRPEPAERAPARPAAADKSIAVLPFANMSADKENDFLADGIHEDVLTSLAKIRDLKVISRTSVLAYRDTASPAKNTKRSSTFTSRRSPGIRASLSPTGRWPASMA